MASARKTGTNEQVTTYHSGGGKDYSVIDDWEAATDTNHVADAETDVLECYAGVHNDSSDSIGGSTNDASYFRIIRPAAGEFGNRGIPDGTGVEFNGTANVHLFRLQETYTQIQDVKAKLTVDSTSARRCFVLTADEGAIIGCVAYDGTNIGTGSITGFIVNVTNNAYIIDCLSHNNDEHGFQNAGGSGFFYNCTSTNNTSNGMYRNSGTAVRKNCITQDNGTNLSGTWTSTTCSDGGSPTFVDSANDDFHLDSSDTVAKGNGTDLSADGSYAFDDDIDGDTMSDWPIGFDEPVAVGGIVVLRRRIEGD